MRFPCSHVLCIRKQRHDKKCPSSSFALFRFVREKKWVRFVKIWKDLSNSRNACFADFFLIYLFRTRECIRRWVFFRGDFARVMIMIFQLRLHSLLVCEKNWVQLFEKICNLGNAWLSNFFFIFIFFYVREKVLEGAYFFVVILQGVWLWYSICAFIPEEKI